MQLEEQPQDTCPVEVKHVADRITQARPAKKKEIKALLAAAEAFKGQTDKHMTEEVYAQQKYHCRNKK